MGKQQDNYLGLKSYQGHAKTADNPEFSTFENEGEFYFAMHDKDDHVVLRSEGYTSTKGRDNGINSVIKNRAVEGRFIVEEFMSKFFVILKAGNIQEIARSTGYNSWAEAQAFVGGYSGLAPATNKAPVAATAGLATGIAGFVGKTYAGKTRIVTGDDAKSALSTGKIINETRTEKGTSRILGERKLVKENRKDLGEKSRKTINETRNVISETRNQISENKVVTKKAGALALAALAGPAIFKLKKKTAFNAKPTPQGAAFVPEPVDDPNDFKFWPLLLLFIPFLFIWGCPPPVVAGPVGIFVAAPVVAAVVAPVCDCDAHDHPVFKLPKNRKPKKITRLGTWPEFKDSHGLDSRGFYEKLKNRHEISAIDKKFLDDIFNEMGFDGFKEARASDFTEVTLKSGVVGNLGGGEFQHRTEYYKLVPTNPRDLEAFKITAKNGCHLHFMKTCGNHMYTQPCPADE